MFNNISFRKFQNHIKVYIINLLLNCFACTLPPPNIHTKILWMGNLLTQKHATKIKNFLNFKNRVYHIHLNCIFIYIHTLFSSRERLWKKKVVDFSFSSSVLSMCVCLCFLCGLCAWGKKKILFKEQKSFIRTKPYVYVVHNICETFIILNNFYANFYCTWILYNGVRVYSRYFFSYLTIPKQMCIVFV